MTSDRAGGAEPPRDSGPAATAQSVARPSDRSASSRRTGRAAAAPGRAPRSKLAAWFRETAIIVVSALVLSLLIKTFLVQAFFIPSVSMQDTLLIGDRVLVNKLAPGPWAVHRGDIVVFKDPGGWLPAEPEVDQSVLSRAVTSTLTFVGLHPQDAGEHLIKRVIGLPGDTVECCDAQGRLIVNGTAIDEPYVAAGVVPSEMEFEVTVPEGGLWVMGDNRQNSQDSRYHQGDPGGGSIPLSNVVGVTFVKVWPVDRWGVLRNPGETFVGVPVEGAPAAEEPAADVGP